MLLAMRQALQIEREIAGPTIAEAEAEVCQRRVVETKDETSAEIVETLATTTKKGSVICEKVFARHARRGSRLQEVLSTVVEELNELS